jgi:hypothetical protein
MPNEIMVTTRSNPVALKATLSVCTAACFTSHNTAVMAHLTPTGHMARQPENGDLQQMSAFNSFIRWARHENIPAMSQQSWEGYLQFMLHFLIQEERQWSAMVFSPYYSHRDRMLLSAERIGRFIERAGIDVLTSEATYVTLKPSVVIGEEPDRTSWDILP